MTPRDMQAAARGHGRAERTRFVYMAQAFGADLTEAKAKRIIEGEGAPQPTSFSEHEENLQALADKHDWEL